MNYSIIPTAVIPAIAKHFPHKRHNIVLVILLAVGLFLRLQKLPAVWDGDNARDFVVATHIVKYHEFPQVGYFASGINFYYPPYWYYFLASLIFLNSDLFFVISLIVIAHTLSIITVYQIGRILFKNSKTGLLSAFFFTIAATEIFLSRTLMGNAVIIPASLFSILLFIIYLTKAEEKYLYGSYVLVFICALMNYPTIILIFVYSLFTVIKFRKIRLIILLNLIFFVLFALAHVPLLKFLNDSSVRTPHVISISLEKLFHFSYLYLTSVYYFIYQNIFPTLVLLALLFIVNVIINVSILRSLSLLLTSIALTILATVVINNGGCCATYFSTVYPLYYIIVAFLIIHLIRNKYIIPKLFAVFSAVTFTYFFINDMDVMYTWHDSFAYFENIAKQIIKDSQLGKSLSYNMLSIDDFTNWNIPAIWYFLEEKTGGKFVRVKNSGFNLEISNSPQLLYFFCREKLSITCLKYLQEYSYNDKDILSILKYDDTSYIFKLRIMKSWYAKY